MNYDITNRVLDRIGGMTDQAAAELFNTTENTIKKWKGGTGCPSSLACQVVIDEDLKTGVLRTRDIIQAGDDQFPQGQTIPTKLADEKEDAPPKIAPPVITPDIKPVTLPDALKAAEHARRYQILIPSNADLPPANVESLMGLWKGLLPKELAAFTPGVFIVHKTTPSDARNRLADAFLKGRAEWACFLDRDIVAPIGNADWFRAKSGLAKLPDRYAGLSAFRELCSNNELFCGAPYRERTHGGRWVASFGMNTERSAEEKKLCDQLDEGPFDKVVGVKWMGFGCVTIHREVFEAILKKCPDAAPMQPGGASNFFTPIPGVALGEDMAFCKRATDAGHQPHVDCSIRLAHLGTHAYV